MKRSIFPTTIETTRELILHVISLMNEDPTKPFYMAVSGGCTYALMFDLWANEYADITPWERLRIFWVDERCVPPEDSDSNYGMARTILLGMVPIPYNNVFRIRGESKSALKEASHYSELVNNMVPSANGLPRFDLVLLGIGEDGHTASIFPGQEELLFSNILYDKATNPYNGQKRITMTGRVILNASRLIFFVVGRNKQQAVEEICKFRDTSPAAYIMNHAEEKSQNVNDVQLFADEDAAEADNS